MPPNNIQSKIQLGTFMLVLWCVYVGNNNSSATSLFKRWPKIALLQSKDVPFLLQLPFNFPFFSEEQLGRNKKLMRWISGWPRELFSQQVLSSCWNLILESLKLKANYFIHFKSLKLKPRLALIQDLIRRIIQVSICKKTQRRVLSES